MKTPKGIGNLGNSCYLNAFIQIVSRLSPLNDMVYHMDTSYKQDGIYGDVWQNWRQICMILHSQTDNKDSLYPQGLVSAIQKAARENNQPFFIKKSQEDFTEFFIFFVECLHKYVKTSVDVEVKGKANNMRDNIAISVCKKMKELYENDDYSRIKALFENVHVNCIYSKDSSDYSFSPDLCTVVNLHFLFDHENTSVYDCIDMMLRPQPMIDDGKWFNDKTNTYETAEKKMIIWKFSQLLVLCLQRFNLDGTKNDKLVHFPLELDLRKYAGGYIQTEYVYDLVGVCNHVGRQQFGHYTAFVKEEDKWFHCNDDVIQIVDNEDYLVSPNAYCLFYVKKNNPL